ncbi:MAG: DUF4143 domain-containing protein [bacterium]|nr:DUF4143 domain-containing protein [bacterium]
MEYKKRIIDETIKKKLRAKGAVLVEGPKWCGKTTSCEQISKSKLYMSDPSQKNQNILLAQMNPELLLEGETPRLIDEWQIAPKLWDAIRFEVDHRNDEGQFLLTGSTTPVNKSDIDHSGTGRFSWVTMRPMSLYESGESNGSISLNDLFEKKDNIKGINNLTLNDIAFLTCRGGWPRATFMENDIALEQAFDYFDSIIKNDISSADGIIKDSERVKRLMKSYARNQGTQASIAVLKEDMQNNDINSLNEDTIYSYINALKKIFVIEEVPAWNPNLRSKTAIRSSDTRYFVDPSIATAALGIGPNDLINDLHTFGLIFETLCIRDLKVYAESLNGNVYHYRDANNLECDAVIHLRNGDYGLIEIKLGGDELINEGIKSLLELKEKIDTTKMKKPSFLMVLTAIGKYAYKNENNVYIVPIGTLKN